MNVSQIDLFFISFLSYSPLSMLPHFLYSSLQNKSPLLTWFHVFTVYQFRWNRNAALFSYSLFSNLNKRIYFGTNTFKHNFTRSQLKDERRPCCPASHLGFGHFSHPILVPHSWFASEFNFCYNICWFK